MHETALYVLASGFRQQPYLGLALLMLVFGFSWIAIFPASKWAALWSAVSAAPFGLLNHVWFVPDYWMPVQWRLHFVGFSDLVFAFAAGGVAWVLATSPYRRQILVSWEMRRLARRFLGCGALGLFLTFALWHAGLRMHIASLLAMWTGLAILSQRYLRFRLISLVGALAFGGFYLLALRLSYWLAPEFLQQWNLDALSGVAWCGVPAEEGVWVMTFGAVWPRFMAYVLDAQPMPARQEATANDPG